MKPTWIASRLNSALYRLYRFGLPTKTDIPNSRGGVFIQLVRFLIRIPKHLFGIIRAFRLVA